MMPLLSIKNLSVGLPRNAERAYAVRDLSLDIMPGEILCVIGESGSGKSVLSSSIMNALPKNLHRTAGSIYFEGRDLCTLGQQEMQKIRGRRISMVFQEPQAALNPSQTIGKQIEEIFAIHHVYPRDTWRERVLALLAATRLADPERIARSYPHELSGGQCQRAIIAMALALEPQLLIADEPTTALDVTTQAQILRLIGDLKNQHGHAILFVTHDFGIVFDIADRIAVMKDGELVESGRASEILHHPKHEYTEKLLKAIPKLAPKSTSSIPDKEPLLKVQSLHKAYGHGIGAVQALNNVSFSLGKSRTLAIVGESGSGKSTLARTLVRLVDPDKGSFTISGQDFFQLWGQGLAKSRQAIQMIFQDPYGSLNPKRTVGSIIMRAVKLSGAKDKGIREKTIDLLSQVGLSPSSLDRYPKEFSGGQRQRICIARALAMSPTILVADESVSALDVSIQRQVLDLIQNIQKETGLTLIFITHDLRVAAEISDEIAVMHKGEIVEYGPARQVLTRPIHLYTQQLLAAAPGQKWERLGT